VGFDAEVSAAFGSEELAGDDGVAAAAEAVGDDLVIEGDS
jgi:hypothetical protein